MGRESKETERTPIGLEPIEEIEYIIRRNRVYYITYKTNT
jgi:hypothetical protein